MSREPAVFKFYNYSGYVLWAKFSNTKTPEPAKEGLSRVNLNSFLQVFVDFNGDDKLIYATVFYQSHPHGPLEPVVQNLGFLKTDDPVFMDRNIEFKYTDCQLPEKFTPLSMFNVENRSSDPVWITVSSRADHLATLAEEVIRESENWKKKLILVKLGFYKIFGGEQLNFYPYGYDSRVSFAYFDEKDDEFEFRGVEWPYDKGTGVFLI